MNPLEEFALLLPQICDAETSACPDIWVATNPLIGHGAVVALLAHDFFGGMILRASLAHTPYAHLDSHYWNRINNGIPIDFTEAQFGRHGFDLDGDPRRREFILAHPDTARRYELLKQRAAEKGFEQPTRKVYIPRNGTA